MMHPREAETGDDGLREPGGAGAGSGEAGPDGGGLRGVGAEGTGPEDGGPEAARPPAEPPITIVTVSREFGSGGGDMAAALARVLGWRLVDRDLVQQVAQQLGVSEADVAERDEHVAGIGERVGKYLADAFPEMLLPPPPSAALDHDTVQRLIEATLREAAETPPVVVVGHGGQCIFGERPGTLHVRVRAPFEERARRVAERLGLAPDDARERTREEDDARREYMRRSYGIEIGAARHYDLIVNTARIGIDEVARALAELVRASAEGARDSGGAPRPRGAGRDEEGGRGTDGSADAP